MKAVFDQVLVLILFFALGWFLTGRGKIRDEQAGALSASVVYVFLPCTMLRTFAANETGCDFARSTSSSRFENGIDRA